MGFAFMAASRSSCIRRSVGAVIVKDRHILATGYNGVPRGLRHCRERGCIREELNIPSGEQLTKCFGSHAEENLIVQAARVGVSIKDGSLYCTNKPCSICSKMIINAGIKEIYYIEGYNDPIADELLNESSIKLSHMKSFSMRDFGI